jgi:hypothetical protein
LTISLAIWSLLIADERRIALFTAGLVTALAVANRKSDPERDFCCADRDLCCQAASDSILESAELGADP